MNHVSQAREKRAQTRTLWLNVLRMSPKYPLAECSSNVPKYPENPVMGQGPRDAEEVCPLNLSALYITRAWVLYFGYLLGAPREPRQLKP